eukprot:TRINITY_DN2266_c1_g1_i1.p1 TRINITY_DN2266_c1_g1~~TRINITY_DN2266_c1_g1_i1.p1  ORF type:complete len:505 (+),score=129.05 TRINITY_DN2266_c1_g1_i1:107-1621(+)
MGFADELWDGFEKTSLRLGQGKQFCIDLQAFTKKRIEIERDYAKRLQTLVKTTKMAEMGSVEGAWNSIKTETDSIAVAHTALADALFNRVDDVIKQWLAETQKQRKQLKLTGKKLLADFGSAKKEVESAKNKYEGSRKKQDATQAEMNADAANAAKIQKKLGADQKTSEKADEGYKKAIDKLKVMETKFYDTDLPQILREYESMELARLRVLKEVMHNFADAQAAVPPSEKAACDGMKSRVEAISVDADMQLFTSQTKTGQPKPARVQYHPYDSITGTCKPPSGSTISSSSSSVTTTTSSSQSPLNSSAGPRSTFASGARASVHGGSGGSISKQGGGLSGGASGGASGGGGGGGAASFQVKALYAYNSVEDTEISFNAGDLINVTFKDESGWWEGELNGRVGVFPSNHVEVLPTTSSSNTSTSISSSRGNSSYPAAAAPTTTTASGGGDRCKALYAYVAEDPDELNMQPGDVMTIEDEDDEGWYYGKNQRGEYGKFPSNYVQTL